MSEPIISPWLVYLINVLMNFQGVTILFLLFAGGSFAAFGLVVIALMGDDEYEKTFSNCLKGLKISGILFSVFLIISILIPSKETMYTMLVADQVTYENVDKLGEGAKETVDYIFDKIEEVAKENE